MRTDSTIQGIVIILASVLTMAFADAVVKLVSSDLTVWQVFFARSLFAIPLMIGLAWVTRVGLTLRQPGWTLLRSFLLVVTWLAFYASLPVLSLSAGYLMGIARAYQIAPPQIIATFDYAYLVSATIWGFVFFAERPDFLTICGMVLITLAGLLVALRASDNVQL